MDVSVRKELSDLVEKMTHSGSPSLDETQLKMLKRHCRASESNVRAVYELVLTHLAKKHAEVRLSSFQVMAELFPRSHVFRQLFCSDFQRVAELVTGTEARHPLPAPAAAASRLKETSLLAIRQWNERFGEGYPKLRLGFNHLKHNKKVDFGRLVAQTEAVRRRGAARDARREAIAQQRLSQVHTEITDQRYDIERCVKEMESCFDILVPQFLSKEEEGDETMSLPPQQMPRDESSKVIQESEGAEFRGRAPSSSGSFASLEGGSGESESEPENETGDGDSGERGDGEKMGGEDVIGDGDSGECGDGEKVGGEDVSSEESDVEWEDVEPLPHSPSLGENGIVNHTGSISIQLPAKILLEETEDNASVLTALSETHHLLQDTYLPRVNVWLGWLTKAGEERDLKEIIDLKSSILAVLAKHKQFNIALSAGATSSLTSAQSSPPHTSHPHTSTHTPSLSSDNPQPSTSAATSHASQSNQSLHSRQLELEQDPTTIQAQLGALRRKNSGAQVEEKAKSKREPLANEGNHSAVPVVPFDMDLYHWDNPEGKPPPIKKVRMSSVHQYWGSERDIEISEDERALLRCRTIQFTGQFEPVKWSCRAPLPSGRLCPRRDRLKCPFHGPIIARDEQGRPSQTASDTDSSTPSTSEAATASPAISEAEYRDIEAAVFASQGLELPTAGKGKKGKGRRKKYPGLTDLKAQTDTPRKRVERRIFSKRSLKKVATAMDTASSRRHRDKFGDVFNYALKK